MSSIHDKIAARTRVISAAALAKASAGTKLDDASDEQVEAMLDYTDADLRLKAVAALHEWIETADGDLEEGDSPETMADRLLALFIGVADGDQDGELDDDEQDLLEAVMEAAWDYLLDKGASEADVDALINDGDNDAAGRVAELLKGTIGDGDAALDDMNDYAFTDDVAMDASYKKRLVVRGGKKVRVNKRVSGKVRLTSKQKVSIRKAQRRSHSARAMMRRAKSNRVRRSIAKK